MQMVLKSLAVMGLLLACAPALGQEADSTAAVRPAMFDNPDGSGHPNAVTCRKPQHIAGSRLMAPPVCLINQDWAQLRRTGEDISPDGSQRVMSEKERSLNPQACHMISNTVRGNGMGANMAMGLSFSPQCF